MLGNQSTGQSWMGINYKGSQGQTERAVELQEEEDHLTYVTQLKYEV
jgi:hypothetical protein